MNLCVAGRLYLHDLSKSHWRSIDAVRHLEDIGVNPRS